MKPIIDSLTVQDLYKFSMANAIFHQFNSYWTKWRMLVRDKDVKFTPEMVREIVGQIRHFCTLRFTREELAWMASEFPWLKRDFIDCFLRFFQPCADEIFVNGVSVDRWTDETFNPDFGNGLSVTAKGSWLTTTFYEVPLLAIVNEVYFAHAYGGPGKKDIEVQERTMKHVAEIAGPVQIGTFAEFGLRRRYSAAMQDWIVGYLSQKKTEGVLPGFVGTSNVHLAMKYHEHKIKAVGTMAHEFPMCIGQGDPTKNPAYTNSFLLESWVKEYGVQNGIALTDTIGSGPFLLDFKPQYARVFDGVRHDSGDPIRWGESMIAHYEKCGIDPKTKTLLFSDSLDFDRAAGILAHFKGRAKVSFGIGTYISNPTDRPLNVVMKVCACNGLPVAKLSDVDGKTMCDDKDHVEWLRKKIAFRQEHGL